MISVIVPTNRVGGLDVLFASLNKQTYRDFELILVDSIKQIRIKKMGPIIGMAEANFPFRIIEPRDNPFPNVAYCKTVNSGIAYASGETIVLMCDYSWANPDCLATHAACQAANPGPTHLDYNYCALPALKPDLPFYGQHAPPDAPEYVAELNATTDRYCADLASGKLDPFMWSIFAERPTQASIEALPIEHRHRPCATREADDWNWCSLKNESFPTELLLEMNGFDEAYDESHCWQDQAFSYRLRELGVKWQNGPAETGMVTVANPRHILNVKRLSRPLDWNQRLCSDHRAAWKRLPVNPEWSLRSWRLRNMDQR